MLYVEEFNITKKKVIETMGKYYSKEQKKKSLKHDFVFMRDLTVDENEIIFFFVVV